MESDPEPDLGRISLPGHVKPTRESRHFSCGAWPFGDRGPFGRSAQRRGSVLDGRRSAQKTSRKKLTRFFSWSATIALRPLGISSTIFTKACLLRAGPDTCQHHETETERESESERSNFHQSSWHLRPDTFSRHETEIGRDNGPSGERVQTTRLALPPGTSPTLSGGGCCAMQEES